MQDFSHLWTKRPTQLADAFARAGHEIRLVGGIVRCALANETPNDEDLCTDATPLEMLALAARVGLRSIPTMEDVEANPAEWEKGGLKHGTVPFLVDGETLEVTTLRVDAETDGRHAKVEFVRDFDRDAARRDFTFNAMSVDRAGRLHDPFGGAEDLRNGAVRFVGDAGERIREDYLRILRYYRFRARYGMGPDARATDARNAEAIAREAKGLERISGERIWQEMSRILAHPRPGPQLAAMERTGVSNAIGLPSTPKGELSAAAAAAVGAVPEVVAGMLFVDRPDALERAVVRWRVSGECAALMRAAVELEPLRDAPAADFLDRALVPRSRPDHIAAVLVGLGRPEDARAVLGPRPEFPLKGSDLLAAGMQPGPEVGAKLAELRADWKASGYSAGREELLAGLWAPTPGHA